MNLQGTQKTKWLKLKAEIIKRPFLAFAANFSKADVEQFLQKGMLPDEERLKEIDALLIADREHKIESLRKLLSTKVGSRGAVRFANKVGVSDSTIRNIIDGNYNSPPSYDLLEKLELYFSYASGYSLSVEHMGRKENYFERKVDELKTALSKTPDQLSWPMQLLEQLKDRNKGKHIYGPVKSAKESVDEIQAGISRAIGELKGIYTEVGLLMEDVQEN